MKDNQTPVGQPGGGRLIRVDIDKEMRSSFLDYSMSVIVDRALPDVRDGLKPVHRRILYAAGEAGLTPDKPYRKSATIVGDVLGSYHPHGDASVYDAMVRMAQSFSLRYPLIDGHGNFGSVDGDPPAAYRYTEARLSKMALYMLQDIDKDTIDWRGNFDDSKKEPVVLPSRFPCLLANGSVGIAVGMATNIPPHNLREIIDAADYLIDNPEATLDELMEYIKGPDFPTGGIIMGRSGVRAAYATGRGKVILRSRCEIEDWKNGRERIIVHEIPYMVNKARLIESIAELVKEKRVDQISDLRDESDRDGMRIVIELKKDANAQVVLNQLYSFTKLQDSIGVIMLCLVDGIPRILTLKEMLEEYLKFQLQVVTRRIQYDLKKAKDREHILEGLKMVCDNTDEVISIILRSKDRADSKVNLIQRFGITDAQATAIVAMQLGQLSGMERIKIEEELAAILEKVKELTEILADEGKIYAVIKQEMQVIRDKFGDERRTDIQAVSGEMDIEDLIPVEDCVITRTRYGYVKRQTLDSYHTQRRGGRGISGMTRRDEDFVEDLFVCSTHDYILFFTNRGRMYRLKGYEIAESSRAGRGTNIVNLLPIDKEEKITAAIRVGEMDEGSYLVMVTRKGTIKRTELAAYRNIRKGGLIAISLEEGDELAWVENTSGSDELMVATAAGMVIRFPESDLRPLGRSAMGVRAVRLGEEDQVVGMVKAETGGLLLTVTESGLGRRTPVEDYRLQGRGGKGIRNYNTAEKGTRVAAVRAVKEGEEVILISDDGVIIRIPAEQITVQSRYAGGVRVMRIAEGGRVVSVETVPGSGDGDDEAAPEVEDAAAGNTADAE
ncbi:MAG: DNA gyrase subunit A [Angelakisella sp.]|nr:DNA gyrase subunit A [Angelakisella sp.]MCI9529021.1 DNA gyrase subunit A [Angelakisella sp.]